MQTWLRDGSKTDDQRLDRLIDFDERSRAYGVRSLVTGEQPRTRRWWCPLHLNQGGDGACVGYAWAHEMIALPRMQLRGRRFARDLYWEAQRLDRWPGGSYHGADPVMEGSSVLAGAKAMQARGLIREYRWAFSLDDLVLAVGHAGPAVLGIPWYSGLDAPTPTPDGELLGHHAILAKGVDVDARTFRLHNSWGVRWGRWGDCEIGWADLAVLLARDGEACIPIR